MTDTNCPQQFATRLLTDIGVCENKIPGIIDKLNTSVDIFNQDRPTTTISIIANDLYQCLRPTANDIARITADELTRTLVYILILTAMFIILIAIILTLLDSTIYNGWSILISIIFAILYIIIVLLVLYNADINISQNITNAQNKAKECVNKAVVQLTAFEDQNDQAILNGLCAYPNTVLNC